MRATVSADGQTVTLTGPSWSYYFPASRLADHIAFYRAMAQREHPRFGGTPFTSAYAPTIRALERAAKILTAYGAVQ